MSAYPEVLARAPANGVRGCRTRAGLSDVTVDYTPGAAITLCSHEVMFAPTPQEAARTILRHLGLRPFLVRGRDVGGGQVDLMAHGHGAKPDVLARVFGITARTLNDALMEL